MRISDWSSDVCSSDLYLTHYVGRPSPLYFAEHLTRHLGGAKVYFKREDLNHTGSHKVNNCMGQILLARQMGKKRIIAETGAGQHGRSEEHTSELQSLMRISYAVFCLKKKKQTTPTTQTKL